MKSLILILALVISSLASASNDNVWLCVGKTTKDTAGLRKLKIHPDLYLSSIDVLNIPQEKLCGHATNLDVQDFCKFEGHRLYIAPEISILQTKTGALINLKCEGSKVVEPQGGGVGGSN
jgi:hypothetical protein